MPDEFVYPRLGAGQFYETLSTKILQRGGTVATGAKVGHLRREGRRVLAAVVESERGSYEVAGRFFLSSAPLTDVIEMMRPQPPSEVMSAARELRYREHIGVNLLIEGRPFPDNWIYVHSPEVALARSRQLPQFLTGHGRLRGRESSDCRVFCVPRRSLCRRHPTSH